MAAPNCTYHPNAWNTDNPSILYTELLSKVGGDRPFTNYVYAHYRQDGIADAMDAEGYKRDKNGEHKAADVYKFFDISAMRSEAGTSISSAAKTLGVMDSEGNLIDFDYKTAYDKASNYNKNSKGGKVAYVQQHGKKFNVLLENTDSRTFLRKGELELQLLQWQTLKDSLGRNGIDVEALAKKFPATVNPLRVHQFLHFIGYLSEVSDIKYLNKSDIDMVLSVASNTPKVKALMSRGWGDTTETAEKAFDVIQNPKTYTPDLVNFVTSAINEGRTVFADLINNTSAELSESIEPTFKLVSDEFNLKEDLNELNEKYGIDTDTIILQTRKITRLSEAAAHSMVTLQRQLRTLERENRGTTAQKKEISETLYQISRELEGKRYYAGLLTFTNKALEYARAVNNELANIPTNGTRWEYSSRRADVLSKAKNMHDSYGYILKALMNLNSIIVDESISEENRKTLQETAKEAYRILTDQESVMNDLRTDTMIDLCMDVFGDSMVEGQSIADFVKNATADSSLMDFLYSVGRQSNPLLAAAGNIIRDTQNERDLLVNATSLDIRRITNKLYSTKGTPKDTKFMYVLNSKGFYEIASDIDFTAFYKAKAKHFGMLKMSLSGYALRDAMDAWMQANTEVDGKFSSTAIVPKRSIYGGIDFDSGWTDAQKEYYHDIMTIKGKLEDLLPQHAQNLYQPPQRRASFLDIIKKGIDGEMTLKNVVKNLLSRMAPWKLQADDLQYGSMLNGELYVQAQGDFQGNVLKEIPVHYTRRLRDQEDLILDFSAALQSLAYSAYNYDAMYSIKNVIDLMADYITDLPPVAKEGNAKKGEFVITQAVHVAAALKDKAKEFGLEQLVESFVDKHIYGIEMKNTGAGWRVLQSLINYTSLNQLAPNLKGAMSNFFVGEHQMLIEAFSGTLRKLGRKDAIYTLKDYAAANALMFGTKIQRGTLMDHLSNNVNSLAHLLAEQFDPLHDIAQEQGGKRYYSSAFRQLIGGFNLMGMYSAGEAAIHYVNMYACLLHQKVKNNKGKEVSLYSAFKRSEKINGNAELEIKDGYTQLDGTPIDKEFLQRVKEDIKYINQNTHGAMNKEDKGLIHQWMLGRAVMNFRQWMVEHYSRRFRQRHWDYSRKQFVEGYFNTTYKFMKSFLSDYIGFINDANCHWSQLDGAQKQNVFRAGAEVILLGGLYALSAALGDPDEHKGEFWYRMWIYQVKRLILDEEASTWGIPKEGLTLLDSPVASVKTINGILYPITGIGDINKTIQSGRYKGWNKYKRNLLKNVPFYNQIDQLLHMDEESFVFSVFEK